MTSMHFTAAAESYAIGIFRTVERLAGAVTYLVHPFPRLAGAVTAFFAVTCWPGVHYLWATYFSARWWQILVHCKYVPYRVR